MSFTNIQVHAVWGTKRRYPFLEPKIKKLICEHIKQNAQKNRINIDSINGHLDHLHVLMELHPEYSISKQMQLIKGESSFWTNKNKLVKGNFGWSDKYFAESVSPADAASVRNYINNQEEHHKKISFTQECEQLLKNYKYDYML